MIRIFAWATLIGVSRVASADVSFVLSFSSSHVRAGQTLTWQVHVHDQTLNSTGLAGIAFDLVPSASNPAPLTLVSGSLSTVFQGFSRPNGISNPLPNGTSSASGGTTIVQSNGSVALFELGGMQNTFGFQLSPTLGMDTSVETGVARGTAPVLFAEGSFQVPQTLGQYCLELQRMTANILVTNAPIAGIWPVAQEANAGGSNTAVCFFVIPSPSCDYNQDGSVDLSDVTDYANDIASGTATLDFNQDGSVDLSDVFDLANAIASGQC